MKRDWERHPGPWALSSGVRGYEREAYEGPTRLLPELDIFGWLRFHETLPGALKPDRHRGLYEIHYLRRGHLRWWVERDNYAFAPGCVFIVRPGEPHGGEDNAIQPCEHFWLRFGFPAAGRALPALTRPETARLRQGLERLHHRTFPVSPDVNIFFERLLLEHRRRDAPHAALLARAMFHALLVALLRDHDRHDSVLQQKPMRTWRVRKAQEWLEQQLGAAALDLSALTALVKMTPSALRHRFKSETGETLHEYWLRRRLEEAKQRLARSAQEVTRIAHDLGFSSSQYFSTVFRKHTGHAPVAWRRRNAAG